MNPYRMPSADLMSRVALNEQIPPMPSKTPRLDYIEKHGWESFWQAVDNRLFDDKPAATLRQSGLQMAPMNVVMA